MTDTDALIRRAVLERLAIESQWLDVSQLSVDVADGIVTWAASSITGRTPMDRQELIRLPGVSDAEVTGLRFRLEPDLHLNPYQGGRGAGGWR